jgi:hypothetical protein
VSSGSSGFWFCSCVVRRRRKLSKFFAIEAALDDVEELLDVTADAVDHVRYS